MTLKSSGSSVSRRVSRRTMLRTGAAAVAVGADALLGGTALTAGSRTSSIQQTSAVAGRKFKGWVQKPGAPDKGAMMELTLLPVRGRQVIVRTEATQCCYSNASRMLGTVNPDTAVGAIQPGQWLIHGHGGVGIVEAIGPEVRRVKVGDRVIVGVSPECGECYMCLHGRPDRCLVQFAIPPDPLIPFATTGDGTPIIAATNIGGHSEIMGTVEQWCVAVSSKATAAELAMLHCVGATGLGMTMTLSPVERGSIVVVFGCGPLGLSAVQGARIMGATQIIAVEPAKVRRDLALKLGATTVLDPNAEGDGLVQKIKDMCKGTGEIFSGTRATGGGTLGPDYVIEAVGGDRFKPKVEAGPDPTGMLALQQVWAVCPAGGHIMTCGINYMGNVTIPAQQWTNGSKSLHSSQYGGTHLKRDMPRFADFIDKGLFDAKSLATSTYPLERLTEAFQAVADRTTVGAVIVFG